MYVFFMKKNETFKKIFFYKSLQNGQYVTPTFTFPFGNKKVGAVIRYILSYYISSMIFTINNHFVTDYICFLHGNKM